MGLTRKLAKEGFVWIVMIVTMGFGAIGWVDDYRKVVHKDPEGRLAVVAVLACGTTTYKKGWIAIRNGNLNINALMSIAVTGALNQHGEVLPVGGINEKIEGWFQACAAAGLDGTQGVLIPARNQRHLMLDRSVLDAVERGLFLVPDRKSVV